MTNRKYKKRTQKQKRKNTNNKKRTQKRKNLSVKGKKDKRLNELSDALNSMTEEGFQNLLSYLLTKETNFTEISPTSSFDPELEEELEQLLKEED